VSQLNKQRLVEEVSRKTKLPKTKVLGVIDNMVESIQKALKKGEKVQLVGFGSWKKTRRKARVGRDPRSGEPMDIAPRNVAKFTMGNDLFELLN
jgi:DNA-binding protein HU-beta